MKRTSLKRKSWLKSNSGLPRTNASKASKASKASSSLTRTGFKRPELQAARAECTPEPAQLRAKSLRRTRMKWKPRRAKPGDDPRYLRWVRRWPCCVGGLKCGRRSRAHHAIEMGGQQNRGLALKAPDSETLPLCDKHHTEFHLRQGFCKGWIDEQRRVFQQDEIDRLRGIWSDEQDLGVLQEPARQAV